MKKVKQAKVKKEIITDIICNKCGDSCVTLRSSETNEIMDSEGLIEHEVNFGYYSNHFQDGDRIQFSLCEKCLFDFVKTFKHKVIIK